jgi:2-polyprenyl-6-hydroxyphenyl methylase / 3-demethylubiquinone-9 3-methyltransferase
MERLKYDESHWSREADEEKALEQYLKLGARAFNKAKFQLIDDLLGNVDKKRILDYGGGAGIMSIPLAKKGGLVTLVDAEENALRTARFYASGEGVSQNIRTIRSESVPGKLKKERFDIVMAKDIIEHIQNDEQFLKDLSDCQEKNGLLLLSTQNSSSLNYILEGSYQKLWCKNPKWYGWDPTHLRFYTPSSLKRKLINAGYQPEKWASVFIIPYNILSWLFLLKRQIYFPGLHRFDLLFGKTFPFNKCGWNIIVYARKQ